MDLAFKFNTMRFLIISCFFASLIAGCNSASAPAVPDGQAAASADVLFERNAQTARQLILDFDAESDNALSHFADSAIWTPTRFGQTDTVPLEQAWAGWKRAWAAYDMELLSDIVLLPGVNPQTKEPDGSVRVYFDWAYTRAATDSAPEKTVQVSLYEAWEFDADGKIWMTQLYGDIGAMLAELQR